MLSIGLSLRSFLPNDRRSAARTTSAATTGWAASRHVPRRARPEPVPDSELEQQLSPLFIPFSLARRTEVNELSEPLIEPQDHDVVFFIETTNPIPFEQSTHALAHTQARVHQVRDIHQWIATHDPPGVDEPDNPIVVYDDIIQPKIPVEQERLVW